MKDDQDTPAAEPTPRRQFLKLAGAAVAAAGFGADALAANTPPAAPLAANTGVDPAPAFHGATSAPAAPPAGYNILFILTDQERHFDRWPFPVPGREALR
ncbi:twin-arginine translocation signal domain-containing protein, partial [Burkholderia contaminans]